MLAALPSVKDTKKRCSLISVLGRIGDDSALQTLRDILRGDDEIEKYAAIRALSDWPNAKPLDDLLKITKASQNEIHRILALRGFVRLIGLKSDCPPEETIEMYELAMNLARSVTEKRMVLSGLANVESPAALIIAAGYLDNKALQTEAEVAVLKIAEAIYRRHPQQTEDALDKIIQTSQSESMRKRARQIVKQINNLKAQTR